MLSQTLLLTSRLAGCILAPFSRATSATRISLHLTNSRLYSTGSNHDNFEPKFNIVIPEDKIEVNFCRSSGPGGQNVNKVNTKAEIRFKVSEADWMPADVRGRLTEYQSNKISKDGYLVINSQEHRCVLVDIKYLYFPQSRFGTNLLVYNAVDCKPGIRLNASIN